MLVLPAGVHHSRHERWFAVVRRAPTGLSRSNPIELSSHDDECSASHEYLQHAIERLRPPQHGELLVNVDERRRQWVLQAVDFPGRPLIHGLNFGGELLIDDVELGEPSNADFHFRHIFLDVFHIHLESCNTVFQGIIRFKFHSGIAITRFQISN
jgi:hypothetical protein